MKQLFIFILVLFSVSCTTPTPAPEPTANVSAILTATAPQTSPLPPSPTRKGNEGEVRTLVVAHRGGAALAPENTLGAFENAIKLGGVDMVECDVHLSKDGELMVMHDPDISRTTDGRGQISELTLAELKKLNAAAKFPGGFAAQTIPTLGELLDLVKGKVGIQIEIKVNAGGARYPGIEKKVVDAVNARGMANDVIIISFDFPTLQEIKKIDSHFKTGALVRNDWFQTRNPEKSVADAIAQTGADYFMPTAGPVNESIVQAAHARGIKMGVWTVDAASDMKRYAGYGIDAITTNRPDELKKVLGR